MDVSGVGENDAALIVSLPADAKVYVNDKLTSTPGTQRHYVSRNLTPGETYTYQVRAEVVREGETLSETKTVELSAGAATNVSFDFEPAETVVTALKLNVPSDARVLLGGAETQLTGSERVFTTNQLAPNTSWDDYKITVEVNRNGRVVRDEKIIDLKAGSTQEITFEFEPATASFVSSR